MQFYCPVCIKTYDLTPEITLTTKLNQQAYKALCPTCQQDVVAYGGQQAAPVETDAQTAVDQALKEFGSVV